MIQANDHLEFRSINQGGQSNHEPFLHTFICWGGNSSGDFNVRIGMALPCRIAQWCDWRRLRRNSGKGAVDFSAPLHSSWRWGWLPHRMVPAVLARRPATWALWALYLLCKKNDYGRAVSQLAYPWCLKDARNFLGSRDCALLPRRRWRQEALQRLANGETLVDVAHLRRRSDDDRPSAL